MQKISIIGAGRLGTVLGYLFSKKGELLVDTVCNQSLASSQAAVKLIEQGRAVAELDELAFSDYYLLAVPDGQISAVARQLCGLHEINKNAIYFHVSGARASAELNCLRQAGAQVASIHPINTFASFTQGVDGFAHTYCSVEGMDTAVDRLSKVFQRIGARMIPIGVERKPLYHAAIVMACNQMLALIDTSERLFKAMGISRKLAKQMLTPILQQTLDNALNNSITSSLTGPIQRGDLSTVVEHLKAIADSNDSRAMDIYKVLSLSLLENNCNHDAALVAKFKQILDI